LKFLTTREAISYFAELGWSIPSRRSIAYDVNIMGKLPPKNFRVYYDSLNNARPVPSPARYNEVENVFRRYFGLIGANEAKVNEAMEKCHKEIEVILSQPF